MKDLFIYLRCAYANKYFFVSLITLPTSIYFARDIGQTPSFHGIGILMGFLIIVAALSFVLIMLTLFALETYESYCTTFTYLEQFHHLRADYERQISRTRCEKIGVRLAKKDYEKTQKSIVQKSQLE